MELFPRSVLKIFFNYLPGSRKRQDWVYLSSEQGVSNELDVKIVIILNQTWILFDWSFEESGIFNLKAKGYLQKQCKEQKSCWDPGGSGSLVDLAEVSIFDGPLLTRS